mmetsp:Transcript_52409/g.63150  ORF Transcript_52409/g.63150 Transcript_52409/m.63150 type:complete len:319 (-) Transcript_52409:195-1151(-)
MEEGTSFLTNTEMEDPTAPLAKTETEERKTPFFTALVAGGLAGTSVDVALFPIDTIKTRLQSPQGFLKAGGFNGIYRGLGATAIGSAPGAALFFSTYETLKAPIHTFQKSHPEYLPQSTMFSHMLAASLGEITACLVRVPTEVIKSQMQTNAAGSNTVTSTVKLVLSERTGNAPLSHTLGGLYRGFGVTLMREIPFALIQMPLYEKFKLIGKSWRGGQDVTPLQAAACGSVAGGIAAAFTTPLDVVKTRLMLGKDARGVVYGGAYDVVGRVWREEGGVVFLSGIQPRVMWISIGGFVFFGAFEGWRKVIMELEGRTDV